MNTPEHPYLQLILQGQAAEVVRRYRSAGTTTAEDDRWGGYALYLMADLLCARDQLGRAVARGCDAARVELATVYRHLGEVSLAWQVLDDLTWPDLIAFDCALAERERGMLLISQGRLEQARSRLEQVWTSVQSGPAALKASTALVLGTIYGQLGQDLQAVHLLNAAVQVSQGTKQGYPLAARSLSRAYAGDFAGAEEDLRKAQGHVAQVPLLASVLAYNRGVLRRAQGRCAEAASCFQDAVRAAGPETEVAFFAELCLCALQTASGQLDQASATLARASRGCGEPRLNLFWQWRSALLESLLEPGLNSELSAEISGRLVRVKDGFLALGFLREVGWVCLALAELALRREDRSAAARALRDATDMRHRLGSGSALVIELRDLPMVRRWLQEQSKGYAHVLLEDWTALGDDVPLQVMLVTLGTPQIVLDGQVVPLRLRRSVEVLTYLVDRGPVTREQLLTALWPETAPKDAANYFHQVKNKLETCLPGLTLPFQASSGTYSVCLRGVRLCWDVDTVKRLLSRGDDDSVYAAVQAYTGAFLPAASGQWAQEVRREVEWSVIKAGLQLIERWHVAGQSHKCLELSSRLREIEPYNEVLAEYLVMATLELEGFLSARHTLDIISGQFRLDIGEVPPSLIALEQRLNSAS